MAAKHFLALMALALGACRNGESANEAAPPTPPIVNEAASPAATDKTSPAAARAVVADYAALAATGDFPAAAKLWSDAADAAQFSAMLEDYPKVAMMPGEPASEEGAAGSLYVTVPVAMNLTLRSGSPYEMTCKAVLRRVNNVPGATAEQLKWRIQSIDC